MDIEITEEKARNLINFIKDDFYIQDKKRLQFREDYQNEDAYLCAQIQQAYRVYWTKVLNIPLEDNLCAREIKPMFYPIDPRSSPLGMGKYTYTKTGRV